MAVHAIILVKFEFSLIVFSARCPKNVQCVGEILQFAFSWPLITGLRYRMRKNFIFLQSVIKDNVIINQ